MHKKEYSLEIGGKTLTAEFNDLANQANGSVMLRLGDTTVLATAVMSQHEQDIPYFPLSVEFEEKFYAAGRILGSRFQRREGRPTEEAILTGRIVDRTIRPLFNHQMRYSVQVVISVLSIGEDDPDVLAVNAASLALATSNIPWNGPVSAIRVGQKKDEKVWDINPTYEFRNAHEFESDILACGRNSNINMIEVGASEATEQTIAEGFTEASAHIEKLQAFQEKIIAEIGKEKLEITLPTIEDATKRLFEETITPQLSDALFSGPGKKGIEALKEEWGSVLDEKAPEEKKALALEYYEEKIDKLLHVGALRDNKRADGRDMDTVRNIYAEAGNVAPMVHGSGVFYRGGTHIFSALTLGGPDDSQILEGMEIQEKKRYMHHYNFPPFSVGETGRVGGFNRRAIGHGALAEKALLPVLPSQEEFPYTIRIVSEVLASNGSSSMGSACGSTLALMDAGVPIKAPVAGIAMGLVLGDTPDEYKILTDIQGPEDHHGDMDFKVAGTREGITAIQMDVKVDGVPIAILAEALEKAKAARVHILDVMEQAISAPRAELSPRAPRILMTTIKEEQIGMVIGSGGKTVNQIKELTGAEISIEDDGTVYFTGDSDGTAKAKVIVDQITREYKAGEKFEGVVTRVADFGAFVRLGEELPISGMKSTEGLVHVSKIAPFRINDVSKVLSVGEKVPVIIQEIDEQDRINLSIKDVDPEFATRKGIVPLQNTSHGGGNKNHKSES